MRRLFGKLRHLPRIIWLGLAYGDAAEDVTQGRYPEARRKLLRIQERSPQAAEALAPVSLLLSLVHLRLGDVVAAAEMAHEGIVQARSLGGFISPAERAYMSYAGKLIYERATQLNGQPMMIDVAVRLEDLRLDRVRALIRNLFPLAEFVPTEGSSVH